MYYYFTYISEICVYKLSAEGFFNSYDFQFLPNVACDFLRPGVVLLKHYEFEISIR